MFDGYSQLLSIMVIYIYWFKCNLRMAIFYNVCNIYKQSYYLECCLENNDNNGICAIKFNSQELILTKVLQFFFFFTFQLIFLIFGIIDSMKIISFLEK
ncbi:unnamed protein product [Paramecium sonneborni]|uniref:Transmembrane protein n=1 Tax=Paramecium sonneborni TaxID=65129 RepID=A0A8S1MGT8_9CILI|nr:unnamed protein product [Paramecium sonneborni]